MKSLGLIGATGLVGQTFLQILNERHTLIPQIQNFQLAASPKYLGRSQLVRSKKVSITTECDSSLRVFCTPTDVSQKSVPISAEGGAWVVDTSSAFRLDPDVLLCVPEINGEALRLRLRDQKAGALLAPRSRIIASPSSSATLLAFVLNTLEKAGRVQSVHATSFLSASHLGRAGLEDLETQRADALKGREVVSRFSSHPIWDQCLPNGGESQWIAETQKILGRPTLEISATAVRVPVTHGEAQSLSVKFDRPVKLADVREALQTTTGIVLQDHAERGLYPVYFASARLPMESARGNNAVFVGRLREEDLTENGLNLWVVSDNLRKGAAWNAIQIVETLLSQS